MKLIVGLGNPGEEYRGSRHNVGFMTLDRLVDRFRFSDPVHEKDALTRKGRLGGRPVMIAWPLTYMNLSGKAVSSLVRSYLEEIDDLVVVYDDVDLDLGRIRIRTSGSAGTHNGMRSIIDHLGSTAFPRIRLGVRGADFGTSRDLADYVLDEFAEDERQRVDTMISDAVEALVLIARGDVRRAMNELNRSREPKETDEGSCDVR